MGSMATKGHPFYTEDLDDQRREQRALLAGMSEKTFAAAGIAGTPAVPASDPNGRVETTLRRLAQSVIDETPAEVLDRIAPHVERQALRAWARHIDIEDWPGRVVDMIDDESKTRFADESAIGELAREHYDQLGPIATLLVWADDLAGDYADPRIVEWRERAEAKRRAEEAERGE